MYKTRSNNFELDLEKENKRIKNRDIISFREDRQKDDNTFVGGSKISEKEETNILLLNEILKRLTSLESIIINNTSSVKNENSNRKIVVQRDEQGKIIGAEIVEV